jgi:hypothetical protein
LYNPKKSKINPFATIKEIKCWNSRFVSCVTVEKMQEWADFDLATFTDISLEQHVDPHSLSLGILTPPISCNSPTMGDIKIPNPPSNLDNRIETLE